MVNGDTFEQAAAAEPSPPLHRSMHSLRLPWARLALGVLLALGFTLALAAARPLITELWGKALVGWMRALELPGAFSTAGEMANNAAAASSRGETEGFLSMQVPLIDPRLRAAGPWQPAMHALAVVALWIVAGWFSDRLKPAAFLLRFAMLIHGASVLFFLAWPASFPHAVSGHVGSGLRQAWALMLLTPWIHLGTYYLFPFAAWQRVALTSLTLLFQLVLTPLQYATHTALLYGLGLIVMPVLHLLFGVMLPILGFVALYGWGMSWHHPARVASKGGW